jgi:hypothetical protein
MLNFILESLNAFAWLLTSLAGTFDPVGTLYGMLAGTYGGAAIAASSNDHQTLARCYVLSAFLHALIGVAHHLHF